MAVMDAVDTEASLTKFKSLVREKEKKAKRRSISVRWGRYASAASDECIPPTDLHFAAFPCYLSDRRWKYGHLVQSFRS